MRQSEDWSVDVDDAAEKAFLHARGRSDCRVSAVVGACSTFFMQRLPDTDVALRASRSSRLDATEVEDAVKDFLATFHFKTATDEEGRGESGMSPLRHAVLVGNVEVAAELIK